jgi:hypothetical protein
LAGVLKVQLRVTDVDEALRDGDRTCLARLRNGLRHGTYLNWL